MRSITLRPEAFKRFTTGHPWVYSNEIVMDAAAKGIEAGSLVRLLRADGSPLAIAIFNPHTLIAARRLTDDLGATIDAAFFAARLQSAQALRQRLFGSPFYRLIHAEADGMPGLVMDRFGDLVVVQINTAGMEKLWPEISTALDQVVAPKQILLRCDSPAREFEGLSAYVKMAKGELDGPTELTENNLRFLADAREGQKTGWFYDQRDNRAAVAELVEGARVLDLYCYAGGFALACAAGGARAVVAIDRSEPALALAKQAADLNGLSDRCTFRKADAFEELERLAESRRTLRGGDCRSAGLREVEEGFEPGRAGLSQTGAPIRLAGEAGRVPVHRLMLAQHAGGGVRASGQSWAGRYIAWGAHPARGRGGIRSPAASSLAGKRLSQIAAAAARLRRPIRRVRRRDR